MSSAASFVLFPLGERRFALPAEQVAELARPGRLQEFPHTTPSLAGVLVRRGRIVPVCDIAHLLVGPNPPARRFYLMAHADGVRDEWMAIPVTGECELASSEVTIAPSAAPPYVIGTLRIGEEHIPLVDLAKLVSREVQ